MNIEHTWNNTKNQTDTRMKLYQEILKFNKNINQNQQQQHWIDGIWVNRTIKKWNHMESSVKDGYKNTQRHRHTHTHLYINIYIYS